MRIIFLSFGFDDVQTATSYFESKLVLGELKKRAKFFPKEESSIWMIDAASWFIKKFKEMFPEMEVFSVREHVQEESFFQRNIQIISGFEEFGEQTLSGILQKAKISILYKEALPSHLPRLHQEMEDRVFFFALTGREYPKRKLFTCMDDPRKQYPHSGIIVDLKKSTRQSFFYSAQRAQFERDRNRDG